MVGPPHADQEASNAVQGPTWGHQLRAGAWLAHAARIALPTATVVGLVGQAAAAPPPAPGLSRVDLSILAIYAPTARGRASPATPAARTALPTATVVGPIGQAPAAPPPAAGLSRVELLAAAAAPTARGKIILWD